MSQIPWFEVPLPRNEKVEPHNCLFYRLDEHRTYEYSLPQIGIHPLILGSSTNGFLICLDKATANLHVINPGTEACIPLPPTSTFSDIVDVNRDPVSGQIASYTVGPSKFCDILSTIGDPVSGEVISCKVGKAPADFTRILDVDHMSSRYLSKAIAIHSADEVTVVVVHKDRERLAFAKPGDTSWTAIHCPVDHHFDDIVYHKGRLHAVSNRWTLDVFDISDPSNGPVLIYDHSYLSSIGDECVEFDMALYSYLVESPNGDELFLVYGKQGFDDSIVFEVFKLDESGGRWVEVQSLDDHALFVGANGLMVLPEPENPVIVRNCIYFLSPSQDGAVVAVFNFADKSTQRLNLNIDHPQKLNEWPWSLWLKTLPVI